LRFPEFDGEWETKKLAELTSWSSGGTPPKDNPLFWNGDIPWISASSMRGLLYSDSETKISKEGLIRGSKLALKGSLLILVRGSMLFNKIPVGIVAKNVAFNQDVKSIVVNNYSTPEYILNWFLATESKLLNMVTGTGIGAGKLDLQDLKELEVKIPSLPEQKMIASFLSLITNRIETQNKILLHYQSLIKNIRNSIFEQKIRFKNECGNSFSDWNILRLGSIAEKRNTKNKAMEIKTVLSNSATLGIVNQVDFFDKEIANPNNINGYYIVEKDDFVYNPRISKEAPVGPISRNKLGDGVMSPLYMVFRFKEADIDYLEHFFISNIWCQHMENIANYGARADRMSFSSVDFFKMPIPIPEIREQIRIANFLSNIDKKIKTEKAILEQMEMQKKYLLKQMFV